MTDDEKLQVKEVLEGLVSQLSLQVKQPNESATIELDQPIGRLSRMDALYRQGIAQKNLHMTKVRLKEVKDALLRIDDEEYGICENCGEKIPFRRLMARPESRWCVRCKEKL